MDEVGIVIPLSLLALIIIVINFGCVIVITFTPWLRRPSNVAIASLLATHLAQGLVVIPSYAIKRYGLKDPMHQGFICDVFRFTYMLMNYANCLTLLIISIDRFISIKYPLKYATYVTKSRIFKGIIISWLYVFALCLLPFLHTNNTDKEGCHYNITKKWSITMLLGNTLLPCIIISFIYIYIFNKARCAARRKILFAQTREQLLNQGRRKSSITAFREIVAAKMSLFIVLVFFLCWGPSMVYYLLKSLCKSCFVGSFENSNAESLWNFLMKLLTFLDALVAPIIYCWMNRGFRIQLKKLLKQHVKLSHSAKSESLCTFSPASRMTSRTVDNEPMIDISKTATINFSPHVKIEYIEE